MKSNNPLRLVRAALCQGLEFSRVGLDPFLSRLRPGKVVLLHVGRSGSTVLGSMLGQHRRVFWDGEAIVQPLLRERRMDGERTVRTLLKNRAKRAGTRFHVISIKFYHLEGYGLTPQTGIQLLEEIGYTHFIVLRRHNLLRKVVSSLVASKTGRYHRGANEAAPQPTTVEIDPSRVAIDGTDRPLLQHLDAWTQNFSEVQAALAHRQHLDISFEEHIEKEPRVAYRLACEYLDIPNTKPQISLQRTNPFELRKLISNADEIASLLSGTSYHWMLD